MLSCLNKSSFSYSKLRMFSTLQIGEQNNGKIHVGTYSALTAALQLNKPIDILLTGSNLSEIRDTASKSLNSELTKNLYLNKCEYKTADKFSDFLKDFIKSKNYTHVITPSTGYSKDFLPRLSGSLSIQSIPEIITIINDSEFQRPVYAGNAIAKVKSSSSLKILSIRPTNFDAYIVSEDLKTKDIENIEELNEEKIDSNSRYAEFVNEEIIKSDRPELGEAKVVVSGGRGLKSGENFDLLYKLADVLGNTAVGASRAAVDAGYCHNDMQIGQTGKVGLVQS